MTELTTFKERLHEVAQRRVRQTESEREGLRDEMQLYAAQEAAFLRVAGDLHAGVLVPRAKLLADELGDAHVNDEPKKHTVTVRLNDSRKLQATIGLTISLENRVAGKVTVVSAPEILPIFFDVPRWEARNFAMRGQELGLVENFIETKVLEFAEAVLTVARDPRYRRDRFVKDPVCGMTLDPDHAAGRIDHCGQTFYFCVEECRQRFLAGPDRYLGDSAVGRCGAPATARQEPDHA